MSRKLVFASEAWEDYLYWQATDKALLRRVHQIIKDIQRSPYEGLGKPEPLKHQLTGWWSRRLNIEHRLIYRVTESAIEFASFRNHY